MSTITANSLFVTTICLGGCASLSPNVVANPSNLTIEKTMEQIGDGFAALHNKLSANKLTLGLFPCSVLVVLNVTAGAKDGSELVLDTTIKPPIQIVDATISGKFDQTASSEATRNNTVTISLVSPACIAKDTLAFDKPDKVSLVGNAISTITNPNAPNTPFLPFSSKK